ncbi:MAG: amino acid ABC transporter permease [Chitinispirillia bacterium]|nr:amino acid ABC transporter permease [Chitinispirillia bacterium]
MMKRSIIAAVILFAVLFTAAFAESGPVKTNAADKKENAFVSWVKTGVERNLVTDNRWKMIVDGLGVTMLIAVAAQFLGTVFGAFVCFLLMRKNRFLRGAAKFYCAIIRGMPMVVLLMIAYYIVFGSADISNILVAILAFAFVTGVDIAQCLKGAIDTVDSVEVEAARSIGFSSFRAFTAVTLPQAVRRALPAYTNGFVELVKATAIVGFIAIQDLTRAGDIIRGRTYDAYFPLLLVALIYLAVTAVCVWVFKIIIKKVNAGQVAQ